MLAIRKYAQTQNETASKERLMVLLFEAALRHMRRAAVSLEGGRAAEAGPALNKAGDIVAELLATLDHSRVPQLASQLSDLYIFVADRLIKAGGSKNPVAVREAERVFAPIAEAFSIAVNQLQGPAK
ncbi:MAG TPA: flagellar export chaperone FliS [Polyangia bacterium]|jgi:flagellar protein FliS|nr:flagellar export chaperone FliS [Polyangia bacterium]